MLTRAPKGTKDISPQETPGWQAVESLLRELCREYGYGEIRTPVFEHTELFERGVGDTTDVVQKEMYTFQDKGGRSITLRPEGTAGAVRAYLENRLYAQPLPVKLYYQLACYRYEKPQAGRLREFHQFGVECFGANGPAVDAEIISLAHEIFRRLGVSGVRLHLSSIGCPTCRKAYNEKLIAFLEPLADQLCDTCRSRLHKNPLRIFDCKSPDCQALLTGAPLLFDHVCPDCHAHFDGVGRLLTQMGIPFEIDKTIVRGLDYYTRTVFEFVSGAIGAQGTVCGGGRYDGLVQELGGDETPGIGFAMGMERLLLLLESEGISLQTEGHPSLFIASIGDAAAEFSQKLAYELRGRGLRAEADLMGRSLKAQMKFADKSGFTCAVCLGDEEISRGQCTLKNLRAGTADEVAIDALYEAVLSSINK